MGWNAENWPEEMERCGYFVAAVTEGYFQKAICEAQVEHARSLRLPVFVLVYEGAHVPNGAFDGCDVWLRETFSSEAELNYSDAQAHHADDPAR